MESPPDERRLVVSLAPDSAFAPRTRIILARLGYPIVLEAQWKAEPALAARTPDLLVVDPPALERLAREPALARIGRVLVAAHEPDGAADRLQVGALQPPAGLHELYRVLQAALEATPRSAIRVETDLPARLSVRGDAWQGEIRSLSENGCLVRSPRPLLLGSRVELSFELPGGTGISLAAESSYRLRDELGLVFHGIAAAVRREIGRFVERALAAA